ncbi:unnamed protein product [Brugia timori]|uniref:Transposase n=1 Tax=Brugia timori TaxID=42155 RepID=A0A0R3QJ71_9BILA|nr:unnamed protein product [Brugia timori]
MCSANPFGYSWIPTGREATTKLDPLGLGNYSLSFSSFEQRLKDFYRLTEDIHKADLEQRIKRIFV